jgi:hypothetical protein
MLDFLEHHKIKSPHFSKLGSTFPNPEAANVEEFKTNVLHYSRDVHRWRHSIAWVNDDLLILEPNHIVSGFVSKLRICNQAGTKTDDCELLDLVAASKGDSCGRRNQ